MSAFPQIDTVLGPNGDTLVLVSDDEDPIEASPPPSVRATIKKKPLVPFSRADYARRRQSHTPEERDFQRHLTAVFGRKLPWNRVRFYVWYANQGNPRTPIQIE